LTTGFKEHDLRELLDKIEDIKVLYPHESMLSQFSRNIRTSVLYKAVARRDNLIPLFLSYGANINLRIESGETALHGVVSAENRDIVRELLDNSADINGVISPLSPVKLIAGLRIKVHTMAYRLDLLRYVKPHSLEARI
jgi:ankyrin repeat protein